MTIIKVKQKHVKEVGGRFVAVGVKNHLGKATNIRAYTLMDLRQQLETSTSFRPASWSQIEERLDTVGIWELHSKSDDPSFE
jgi:hypothetical protein